MHLFLEDGNGWDLPIAMPSGKGTDSSVPAEAIKMIKALSRGMRVAAQRGRVRGVENNWLIG